MNRYMFNKRRMLDYLIFSVFFSIYIIPGIKLNGIPIGKVSFVLNLLLIYGMLILKTKQITKKEILYLLLIGANCTISGSVRSVVLVTLLPLVHCLNYWTEEEIKERILKKEMLYLALAGVCLYSFVWYSHDGRFIHTALKDINESSLGVFCLGVIVRKKNRILGRLVLICGLLTLSRNYWLAMLVLVFFESGYLKQLIRPFRFEKWSFFTILLISSSCLLGMGVLFLIFYKENQIMIAASGLKRVFTVFDTSNYDRFTVNFLLGLVLVKKWSLMFSGIPNYETYVSYMAESAKRLGVPYRKNVPHNYVFSSMRLYGIPMTVLTILILSGILKKVVDKENYPVFWGVISYAVFLGSGFEMYWAYLTFFTLIVNKGE